MYVFQVQYKLSCRPLETLQCPVLQLQYGHNTLFLPALSTSTASPEPAAMFQVTDTTNSSISFSWAEQFNGLVDITGARLEYTVVGSGDAPMGVEVGRRSGMVMGLTAFANYNVSLFLRNGLGLSDPVSLFQQTDSNCELQ